MLNDENLYSQFVSFFKTFLPLTALGLMCTVFLFARAPTQEPSIPFAEIEALAQEPRLDGARISGLAADGSMIELSARTTRPEGDLLMSRSLSAGIDTLDGTRIDIRAGEGEIDNTNHIARLFGLARLVTSNGYEMESAGFTTNFQSGRIVSDGAIEVQAPFGTLTAGLLVIETPEGASGQVMLFQDGVRLIYMPQQ